MPDEVVIQVEVVLKDESDKKIDSVTIDVPPGEHIFKNLSPGNYTLTFIVPTGWSFEPPNPSYKVVAEGENSLPVHVVKTGGGLGSQGGGSGNGRGGSDNGSSPESPPSL